MYRGIFLLFACTCTVESQYDDIIIKYLNGGFQNSTSEDFISTIDSIRNNGYIAEEHYVVGPEGNNLSIHRIPHGNSGRRNGRVALLMHGILTSSYDWVLMGPGKALAYMLADEGYDVWMGNARGNVYSRNHVFLDPDNDTRFWDFSWHEVGKYDLPAMIDYILDRTGKDSLYYTGHSLGNTLFSVMTSLRPEYNKKIKVQVSLAPVAFVDHVISPLMRIFAFWEKPIEILEDLVGPHEFLPSQSFLSTISKTLCKPGNNLPLLICENTLFALAGYNPQMNITLLPIIMSHVPAGCSTKEFIHLGQEMRSGHFRQYDYGTTGNQLHYNQNIPPDYELKNITTPVYLIYSQNDWLVTEKNTMRLCNELGVTCRGTIMVSDFSFNHLDFVYGVNAPKLVYSKIISIFDRN